MKRAPELGSRTSQAAPRVVCAWCDDTLSEGTLPPSHGICPECALAFYEQLGRLPRSRTVAATFTRSVA